MASCRHLLHYGVVVITRCLHPSGPGHSVLSPSPALWCGRNNKVFTSIRSWTWRPVAISCTIFVVVITRCLHPSGPGHGVLSPSPALWCGRNNKVFTSIRSWTWRPVTVCLRPSQRLWSCSASSQDRVVRCLAAYPVHTPRGASWQGEPASRWEVISATALTIAAVKCLDNCIVGVLHINPI